MERGEHLFRGEFFFVVGSRDFQHQEDGVGVEDGGAIVLFVIFVGQVDKKTGKRNPDERRKEKTEEIHIYNIYYFLLFF